MNSSRRRLLKKKRTDENHVVVETPEHEIVELEGCSEDEVEAKLHDLETWAS